MFAFLGLRATEFLNSCNLKKSLSVFFLPTSTFGISPLIASVLSLPFKTTSESIATIGAITLAPVSPSKFPNVRPVLYSDGKNSLNLKSPRGFASSKAPKSGSLNSGIILCKTVYSIVS